MPSWASIVGCDGMGAGLEKAYHIAGNFRGVKFSRNDDYKVFVGLIFEDRCACDANDRPHPTILTTPPAGSDTRYGQPPLEKSYRDRVASMSFAEQK